VPGARGRRVTATHQELLARVSALRGASRAAAEAFLAEHRAEIEAYRAEISLGIDEALARMRDDVARISEQNAVAVQLAAQASEYVSWMQWSLWDLPVFAVAVRPAPDAFRRAVAACGLVHIAITRVFDDIIDQHVSYKGRHDTLLAAVSEARPTTQQAVGLSILAGLLLCFEGLDRLADPAGADGGATLRALVGSLRRTVIGAIIEYTDLHEWSLEEYDRLVRLKNVESLRALYSALDPGRTSALLPFLERYFELAQYLNDVQDQEEDLREGQPNLVSLSRLNGDRARGDDRAATELAPLRRVPVGVERRIAETFLDLGAMAEALPALERGVALSKLSESCEIAYRLGLFVEPAVDAAPPPAPPARLFWFSELQQVVEEVGPAALVSVACGACGSRERRPLFQKQGFAYHRCAACSHVYVSPRISGEVQARLLEDDPSAADDRYLEAQRMYAEFICHWLSLRTSGARLLDLGFGRGYLMRVAPAYGFEVYGVDSSQAQVDRLTLEFGDRVARAVVGRDPIPWQAFDVVVMSHVLEHLPDPRAALEQVADVLNPGGLLYVAVPDLGSMHFKVLGKHWEAINPLVHLQYFTETSLSTLLTSAGFDAPERLRVPALPDEMSPRWMRLMRQLGGGDSDQLTVLARTPDAGPR